MTKLQQNIKSLLFLMQFSINIPFMQIVVRNQIVTSISLTIR